MPNLDLPR